jgi:hypothetical protein
MAAARKQKQIAINVKSAVRMVRTSSLRSSLLIFDVE